MRPRQEFASECVKIDVVDLLALRDVLDGRYEPIAAKPSPGPPGVSWEKSPNRINRSVDFIAIPTEMIAVHIANLHAACISDDTMIPRSSAMSMGDGRLMTLRAAPTSAPRGFEASLDILDALRLRAVLRVLDPLGKSEGEEDDGSYEPKPRWLGRITRNREADLAERLEVRALLADW